MEFNGKICLVREMKKSKWFYVFSVVTILLHLCLLTKDTYGIFIIEKEKVLQSSLTAEKRIAGKNRFETAARIAQTGWKDKSQYAILAAGDNDNLIDALTAAPLAGLKNAPILFTDKDELDQNTEAELKRLGVETVYLVSGNSVLTERVRERLHQLGIKIIVLGGKNRYQTAINIAKEIHTFNEIFVVKASGGPDALSIASIAAAKGIPIIITDSNRIPEEVELYLGSLENGLSRVYIIGGKGVISEKVENCFTRVKRIGGADRYLTNLEVLKTFYQDYTYYTNYLASGRANHYADALAGSALAGRTASPIVLTDYFLPEETERYAGLRLQSNFIALGGEQAVSDSVLSRISNSLEYSCGADPTGISGDDNSEEDYIIEIPNRIKISQDNATIKNAKIDKSIEIKGDNVLLDNVAVNGTLFIDPGKDGTARLKNVTAGNILVLSGAQDSIHINNTEADSLIISSSGLTNIVCIGNTRIGKTVISSYARINSTGAVLGTIEVIRTGKDRPKVFLKGKFSQPIIINCGALISLEEGTSIPKLEIGGDSSGEVITLQGQISKVEVNADAFIELTANSRIINAEINCDTCFHILRGAGILNLSKKGNQVTVTGKGYIGRIPSSSSQNATSYIEPDTIPPSALLISERNVIAGASNVLLRAVGGPLSEASWSEILHEIRKNTGIGEEWIRGIGSDDLKLTPAADGETAVLNNTNTEKAKILHDFIIPAAVVRDRSGNQARADIIIDSHEKAVVTGVSSPNADGFYKMGDSVEITVTFSKEVLVSGNPLLGLQVGDLKRQAVYKNGSGSSTISFCYVVKEGDNTLELSCSGKNGLQLNGGTIKNKDNTDDVLLELPVWEEEGSLSHSKDIAIDTVVPKAINISGQNTIPGYGNIVLNVEGGPLANDSWRQIQDEIKKNTLAGDNWIRGVLPDDLLITPADDGVSAVLTNKNETEAIIASDFLIPAEKIRDRAGNQAETGIIIDSYQAETVTGINISAQDIIPAEGHVVLSVVGGSLTTDSWVDILDLIKTKTIIGEWIREIPSSCLTLTPSADGATANLNNNSDKAAIIVKDFAIPAARIIDLNGNHPLSGITIDAYNADI